MGFINLLLFLVPLGLFTYPFFSEEPVIATIFSLVAFALFIAVIPADIPAATPVYTEEDRKADEREMRRQEREYERDLRANMDKGLVRLLDKMELFYHLADRFHSNGITTLAILAGRHAGGSGGIQPARLEREYGLRHGDAVKLKQAAIALVKARPARSPARGRRN